MRYMCMLMCIMHGVMLTMHGNAIVYYGMQLANIYYMHNICSTSGSVRDASAMRVYSYVCMQLVNQYGCKMDVRM